MEQVCYYPSCQQGLETCKNSNDIQYYRHNNPIMDQLYMRSTLQHHYSHCINTTTTSTLSLHPQYHYSHYTNNITTLTISTISTLSLYQQYHYSRCINTTTTSTISTLSLYQQHSHYINNIILLS